MAQGHQILNLDLVPVDIPGVDTMIVDLADGSQTFNALSTHFNFGEFFAGKGRPPVDAVVHFAAIPRILMRPDNTMFAANVLSTYNVIEAATKLGIGKVIIASSETVYGVCFAEGRRDFNSFPVDEDHDTDPMDSYGLSKVVGEKNQVGVAVLIAGWGLNAVSSIHSRGTTDQMMMIAASTNVTTRR